MRSMLPQSRKTIVRSATSSGGRADEAVELEAAVLPRQRELVRRHVHQRVLAELREDAVHREQRAERVAVGVLVGGEEELVGRAQLARRPGPVRWRRSCLARRPGARSMRIPRSIDSSKTNWSVGVCFMRSSVATSLLQEPVRRLEPRERLRALLFASEHGDVHARLAQIWACVHSSHGDESYARVLEALRESRRHDLAHSLVHPAHAVGHPREGLPSTPFGIPHVRRRETSRSRSARRPRPYPAAARRLVPRARRSAPSAARARGGPFRRPPRRSVAAAEPSASSIPSACP